MGALRVRRIQLRSGMVFHNVCGALSNPFPSWSVTYEQKLRTRPKT